MLIKLPGERINQMEKQTYTISNISCGHCVATIKSEIQDLDGVSAVEGDPETKTITVEWQSPATTSQIQSKLSEIGYPASA
jgi:copper chaperone